MAQYHKLNDCRINSKSSQTGRIAYNMVRIEWSTAKRLVENGRADVRITPQDLADVITGFYTTLHNQKSPLGNHWISFFDQTMQLTSDDIITKENILGTDSKQKYKKGSKEERMLWLTLATYYSLFRQVSEQYSSLEVGIAAALSLTAHRRQHSNKPKRGDASIEMKDDFESDIAAEMEAITRLDALSLEEYCQQSAELRERLPEIQRNGETLRLLASQQLWNDIQTIIDSIDIPTHLQPYFKAFLIKLTHQSNNDNNSQPSNNDINDITKTMGAIDLRKRDKVSLGHQQRIIGPLMNGRSVISVVSDNEERKMCSAILASQIVDIEARQCQVVIISPSRGSVLQIHQMIENATVSSGVHSRACVGGTWIEKDIRALERRNIHIVVGTLGRTKDLFNRRAFGVTLPKILILDGAQKLLSGKLRAQVYDVVKSTSNDVKFVLFSSEMTYAISCFSSRFMRNPFVLRSELE